MKLKAQRYFRNYRAVSVVDEDGRAKTRLLYLGDRYVALEDDAARRRGKWMYALSAFLSDGLLLLALTRNIPSNRQGALAALSMALLFPAFFATLGSVKYLFRPRSMTVTEYRESTVFGKIGFGVGGGLGMIVALWRWIRMGNGPEAKGADGWMAAAACTALAAAQLICFARIMRERYRIIPANQIETKLEEFLEKEGCDADV